MQALVIELRYYYGAAVVRLLGPLQSILGLAPLVFNIVPYVSIVHFVFYFFFGGVDGERVFFFFVQTKGVGLFSQSKTPPGFFATNCTHPK